MSQYQRFAFICEYFDPQASLVRQYQLFFYPEDESIEIFDIKTRRIFLKKIIDPYISAKDIFLNAEKIDKLINFKILFSLNSLEINNLEK